MLNVISQIFLSLLAVTTFLVLLSCVLFLAFILHVHWKYRNVPGAPVSSFVFGHIPDIKQYHNRDIYSHKLFLEWAKEYGPVIKLLFFHKCMILVTSPSGIKELLTRSMYPKSKTVYGQLFGVLGERFLGTGLVTNTDHEAWSSRRSLMNPAFNKKCLTSFLPQFNSVVDGWIQKLYEFADHEMTFSMEDMLARVTIDTIMKVGFNEDVHAINSEQNSFPKALRHIMKGISAAHKDPFLKWRKDAKELVSNARNSVKSVRAFCSDVLKKRRQLMTEGEETPCDVLSFLLHSSDSLGLSSEELIDDFVTIFIAGQETTANSLAFLFLELGKNPEVQARLIKEVDDVTGHSQELTMEQLNQLKYTTQVIKECLRMYPPAPATVRQVPQDICIDDVTIPAGSDVIIPFYVVHHLPQFYKDPETFNPDRFSEGSKVPVFSYLPFSLGPRICAGQQFAMMEAKIVLCKFLQTFKFELDPHQSFDIQENSTLRPKGGTMMMIRLRVLEED